MHRVFVAFGLLFITACGRPDSTPKKDQPVQQVEKAETPKPKLAAQIGEIATLKSIAITVTSAEVARAKLKGIGTSETKEAFLIVRLKIGNRSADRKVDFTGWQDTLLDHCTLTDDKDNRYKSINPGLGESVVGHITNESLYPGKAIEDVLVFEPPVKTAKTLTLELEGDRAGAEGEYRFEIQTSAIKR